MTVFTADSGIFQELRNTPNISVDAFNRLVTAANQNVVLNAMRTLAVQNDNLLIRLAEPGELTPGDGGAFLASRTGGRHTKPYAAMARVAW